MNGEGIGCTLLVVGLFAICYAIVSWFGWWALIFLIIGLFIGDALHS